MRGALETVARTLSGGVVGWEAFPWPAVRYQHAQALRAALAVRYAPATANRALAALRGVLKESWRLGLLDAETFHRAVDVENVKGTRLPAGRALSQGDLRKLFAVCADPDDPRGVRDSAIFGLLYSAGLRRSELTGLEVADLNPETGELRVRHGKGSKERVVWIGADARKLVVKWLSIRGKSDGPLFLPVTARGQLVYRTLTAQAVYLILFRRVRQAGIAPASPHDFRRSFIGDLLDGGADLVTVSALAGHSDVKTTACYDRRQESAKRKAVSMLRIPSCV